VWNYGFPNVSTVMWPSPDCTTGTLKAGRVALVEPVAYLKDSVTLNHIRHQL